PVRRRAREDVGHAGRAGARAVAGRRHPAEGVVLRAAVPRDRGHPVDRGQVSGPRRLHGPLGGGPARARILGSAPLVREGRDAGVHEARVSADRLSRPAAFLLAAVACVLALDVLVILYTGGYSVDLRIHGYGLRIAGHAITVPIILLLAVAVLPVLLPPRALTSYPGGLPFAVILIGHLATGPA